MIFPVLHNLYIGDFDASVNREKLKLEGITHIVNCSVEVDNHFPQDFVYFRLNLYDNEIEQINHLLDPTIKFIKEAQKRGKVLVHCTAGISRSATIVVAFLSDHMGMPIEGALSTLRKRYARANPNQNYRNQLTEWWTQKTTLLNSIPLLFY